MKNQNKQSLQKDGYSVERGYRVSLKPRKLKPYKIYEIPEFYFSDHKSIIFKALKVGSHPDNIFIIYTQKELDTVKEDIEAFEGSKHELWDEMWSEIFIVLQNRLDDECIGYIKHDTLDFIAFDKQLRTLLNRETKRLIKKLNKERRGDSGFLKLQDELITEFVATAKANYPRKFRIDKDKGSEEKRPFNPRKGRSISLSSNPNNYAFISQLHDTAEVNTVRSMEDLYDSETRTVKTDSLKSSQKSRPDGFVMVYNTAELETVKMIIAPLRSLDKRLFSMAVMMFTGLMFRLEIYSIGFTFYADDIATKLEDYERLDDFCKRVNEQLDLKRNTSSFRKREAECIDQFVTAVEDETEQDVIKTVIFSKRNEDIAAEFDKMCSIFVQENGGDDIEQESNAMDSSVKGEFQTFSSMQDLVKTLKYERIKKYSERRFCKKIGLLQPQLQRIEKGENKKKELFDKYLNGLGYELNYTLEKTDINI